MVARPAAAADPPPFHVRASRSAAAAVADPRGHRRGHQRLPDLKLAILPRRRVHVVARGGRDPPLRNGRLGIRAGHVEIAVKRERPLHPVRIVREVEGPQEVHVDAIVPQPRAHRLVGVVLLALDQVDARNVPV